MKGAIIREGLPACPDVLERETSWIDVSTCDDLSVLSELEGSSVRLETKASVLNIIERISYYSSFKVAYLRLQMTSKAVLVDATHLSNTANIKSTMQAPAIAPLLDGRMDLNRR